MAQMGRKKGSIIKHREKEFHKKNASQYSKASKEISKAKHNVVSTTQRTIAKYATKEEARKIGSAINSAFAKMRAHAAMVRERNEKRERLAAAARRRR